MGTKKMISAIIFSSLMLLSGCMSSSTDEDSVLEGETLVELDNPCLVMSESLTQSLTSIEVNGVERFFRLSAPSSLSLIHI